MKRLIFTKDPRSPEVIAKLREEGETLVEVTTKQLYHIDGKLPDLDGAMREWFVKYAGRSHAFRDGAHIAGADKVQEVKILTAFDRVVDLS